MVHNNVFKFVSLRPPTLKKEAVKVPLDLRKVNPNKGGGKTKKRVYKLERRDDEDYTDEQTKKRFFKIERRDHTHEQTINDCKKILKGILKGWQYARPLFFVPTIHRQILELEGDQKRDRAKELAKKFMNSEAYMPDINNWISVVYKACSSNTITEAKKIISSQLGLVDSHDSFCAFIKSRKVINVLNQLWNSLYSQALIPDIKPEDRETIYEGIRAFQYILATMAMESPSSVPFSYKELKKVKPLIPKNLIPKLPIQKQGLEALNFQDEIEKNENIQIDELLTELQVIQNSVKELKKINPSQKFINAKKLIVSQKKPSSSKKNAKQFVRQRQSYKNFKKAKPQLNNKYIASIKNRYNFVIPNFSKDTLSHSRSKRRVF